MIIKFLNRKDTEKKTKKKKLKNINLFQDSDLTEKSTQNIKPKIFIFQNLCLYYCYLYGLIKENMNEGLIHDFWISNDIICMKETEYAKLIEISHVCDM